MQQDKRKISEYKNVISKALLMSTTGLLFMAPASFHANAADEAAKELEEVVTIGSRRKGASPSDVPSPISVLDISQLSAQGGTDMANLVRTLVPSFNVSAQTLSGTSSLVRPPNLRGLGADHTLVLVNGKRRHRAANIPNFSGGINDGTQGVDIANIPAIALKSVEVLRDGAAAQYGADAIAGVMNFVANDDPEARSIEVKYGQHYEGDGEAIHVAATFGMALGDEGSFNISGEYTDSNRTNREQQSDGTQALVDAGYTDIRDPGILWGAPEIKDNISLFANLVAPVTEQVELYGYASYNERENISGFFLRNPNRGGVFAIGDERIVFDTTSDGSGNCPVLTVPDLDDAAGVQADLAAIAALRNNPNCFSFLEDFPGGTAPFFSGLNEDLAGSLGFRGETGGGWSYDISYTYGRNEVTYRTFDNFNPTFGPDSPNFLVAGSRIQEEQTFNAQVVYPLEVGFASPLNVAGGFEWHREAYEQVPGQVESYAIGPYTETAQGTQGISVGTLGFGSFNPTTSFSEARSNIAFYLDLEADITEEWTLGAAVRFEDFTDVGSDVNFKIASLYRVTDEFNIRATVSTGFHAPTPGQQNFAQSTVAFDADGNLSTSSTLPAAIASQLPIFAGVAVPLAPETSTNYSLGFSWDTDAFSLTVDFYQIDMKDRITLTSSASIGDADRDTLFGLGFTNAQLFTGVNFFTNDFDTKTQGVDIIGAVPVELTDEGSSEVSLAFNYTKTEVTRQGANLSDLRLRQLEEQLPQWRGNVAFTHTEGDIGGILRVNYFGPLNEYYLSLARLTELDSQITVDVEVNYAVLEGVEISVGAQNLFNSFPTGAFTATAFGNTYPVSSPDGFGGGFYYAKVKYNF